MKHTHTHPNWKNLSEAEKANVRSANWANVRKKERIKELKKWVKSRPNGEAIVELELDYLEGRKEIDDWLKEGNKKTIIPTKENK